MPQIPQSGQRQVRSAPLPGVRLGGEAPLEAFGGGRSAEGVAQETRGMLGDVQQMIEQGRKEADQLSMGEERRALWEWRYQKINDPEKGAINRLGKNAFALPEELKKDFDEFTTSRKSKLTNARQQEMFSRMADQEREEILGWAAGHVVKQKAIVHEADYEASVDNSKDRASWDPDVVPRELAIIRNATQERTQRLGLGEEVTTALMKAQESDLHSRVIRKMVGDGNDQGASGYFRKVEARLDPDTVAKLKPILEEGSIRGESDRIVDNLYGAKINGEKYVPTQDEALERARAIPEVAANPKLRAVVEGKIKVRAHEAEEAEKRVYQDSFQSALEEVERGRPIPVGVINDLKIQDRRALEARAKQLAMREEPVTDPELWADLQLMPLETMAAMQPSNVLGHMNSLSPKDQRALIEDIKLARKATGDKKASAEWNAIKNDRELIFSGVKPLLGVGQKIEMDALSKDQKAELHSLTDQVDARYLAWTDAHNGKPPTDKEKLGIIDSFVLDRMKEVDVEGSVNAFQYFGWMEPTVTRKPVALLKDYDYVPLKSIGPETLKEIKTTMESHGIPYKDGDSWSERTAQQLYTAYLKKDKALIDSILKGRKK